MTTRQIEDDFIEANAREVVGRLQDNEDAHSWERIRSRIAVGLAIGIVVLAWVIA